MRRPLPEAMPARWSRFRWAVDVTTYLTVTGLATFHGIRRQFPDADSLRPIGGWSPFGRRAGTFGFTAAASDLAAEPAVANLGRWRASRGMAY